MQPGRYKDEAGRIQKRNRADVKTQPGKYKSEVDYII